MLCTQLQSIPVAPSGSVGMCDSAIVTVYYFKSELVVVAIVASTMVLG